jgi:peptidoglycan/LPS O-acetylase OafA/YrhL
MMSSPSAAWRPDRVGDPAMTSASTRVDAIDMVKGGAILCVLLIHSRALGESRLFLHVVNQAVPVFIVLFGTNAFLWWSRPGRSAREWYASRVRRILVPMWAALPVWWLLAIVFRPPDVKLTPPLAAFHLAGYLDAVGTGWFITLMIQLALVFPLLHGVVRRVGIGPTLVAGLACGLGIVAVEGRLVGAMGFFNYYVFSPRLIGHVVFGMLVATLLPRLRLGTAAVSTALWLGCVVVAEGVAGPRLVPFARLVTSLPLTVVALTFFARLPRVAGLTPALVWLGRSSYGIYLGQLLTHNAFIFGVGWPELYQQLDPWLYTGILLAGGLFFVALGEGLLRLVATFRGTGAAQPGS